MKTRIGLSIIIVMATLFLLVGAILIFGEGPGEVVYHPSPFVGHVGSTRIYRTTVEGHTFFVFEFYPSGRSVGNIFVIEDLTP